MSTTFNTIAVRASILSFAALSFSTPLFGQNNSDSAVQSIVSPVIPSWIDVPVLVSTAFVPAPVAAPATPPAPLKPGEPVYIEKPKDVAVAQPAAAPAPPPVAAPPAAPETEYLPPKSARN